MRDLAVEVVLAIAINRADPDDAALLVPFASPVRSAYGACPAAVARDRGVGPPAGPFRRTGDASIRATQTGRFR